MSLRRLGPNLRCFSRSGWWQTLCGLDAANQGFGWTDRPRSVGCADCQRLIALGLHSLRVRGRNQVLVPQLVLRKGKARDA